jgi:DNA polymerase lambda
MAVCKKDIKTVRNIGNTIGSHILEIIETGELQILRELETRDDLKTIRLFTGVHGIGPTTAQSFYNQGFRSLDDLKTKAKLNGQQKIGLNYYHDFVVRIPRDEVDKIEKKVRETALRINSALIVLACGSYRRKKPTCGDVDILITHPDGHSHVGVFSKLVDSLHLEGTLCRKSFAV